MTTFRTAIFVMGASALVLFFMMQPLGSESASSEARPTPALGLDDAGSAKRQPSTAGPSTPRAGSPVPLKRPSAEMDPVEEASTSDDDEEEEWTSEEDEPAAEEETSGFGEVLMEAMKENAGELRHCVEVTMATHRPIEGRVLLNIVAEAGEVIDVSWVEDDTHDDVFLTCMEDAMIGMQLGKDVGGEMTLPFTFASAD